MNTLALEPPAAAASKLSDHQRQTLQHLVRRLEQWIPSEEVFLQRARAANRPDLRREAEWRDLLKLYERLCMILTPASA